MMRVQVLPQSLDKAKTEAVAVFLFEGGSLDKSIKAIDKKLGNRISSLIRKKKFLPKKLSIRAVDTLGKMKPETVLLVGLGKKKEFNAETARKAAAKAAQALASMGIKSFSFSVEHLAGKGNDAPSLAGAATEGIILSQYSFMEYKKSPDNGPVGGLKSAVLSQTKSATKVKQAVAEAQKVCKGVFLARDLANHPGNRATPTYIAATAMRECRKLGVRCRVLNKSQIEKLKMGTLLSVAVGSAQPPKFVIMEYMKGKKSQKPVVLVGKGITFDTGGISIKPSASMDEMKFDMSGGAAVIGAMIAVGHLKLKKNIVGLVPLAENMPSGTATKPGDIVRSMSGLTVEVLNTDAEGRLVLADALTYAKRYKPSAVVDIATLTGAIMVALGSLASGLFGNDQKLIDSIKESGERTGERCWPMPLWEEHEKQIKSKVADIKNIGPRWGGAITAAAFLKQFADYPWAHIDIAGSAFFSKSPSPYVPTGGAGMGVRLLIDFLQQRG